MARGSWLVARWLRGQRVEGGRRSAEQSRFLESQTSVLASVQWTEGVRSSSVDDPLAFGGLILLLRTTDYVVRT